MTGIIDKVRRAFGRSKAEMAKAVSGEPAKQEADKSLSIGSFGGNVSQVSSEDVLGLLGRPAVSLDTPELQRFLAGKRVLVTGAGGSIGSEICRQIARFCPARLVLLDRAEGAVFEIDRELRQRWVGQDLKPVVADVCEKKRIDRVLGEHKPQVVFHCAAHKHVPLMENQPGEAVRNNVLGTACVAELAVVHGVSSFVMVSTDKAVNPTSVMGATKRVAELYVQALNELEVTRFTAVRFGNVLGSSGSVVPIFARQISAGGPVTVTHAEMTRYFMTIPEASQLVMQSGAIGKGGEIFILDMGQPVKILDLAHAMIKRAGLVAGQDIMVEISGIRPGEKLFEELAGAFETQKPTSHPRIRVWQLPAMGLGEARQMAGELSEVIDQNGGAAGDVVGALKRYVPEYTPDAKLYGNVPASAKAAELRLVKAA